MQRRFILILITIDRTDLNVINIVYCLQTFKQIKTFYLSEKSIFSKKKSRMSVCQESASVFSCCLNNVAFMRKENELVSRMNTENIFLRKAEIKSSLTCRLCWMCGKTFSRNVPSPGVRVFLAFVGCGWLRTFRQHMNDILSDNLSPVIKNFNTLKHKQWQGRIWIHTYLFGIPFLAVVKTIFFPFL